MSAVRTARERARAELTAEILAAARRQVAAEGAPSLSLRAVARELGMASSALYRYFPTRDDLLTALITDAYDALGAAVEQAAAAGPGRSPRQRWVAACTAVRRWATAHPHEHALLFGSPVPGYAAPSSTVAAGSRVPLALLGVLAAAHAGDADGHGDGARSGAPGPGAPLPPELREQAERVRADLGTPLGAARLVDAVQAWTALFGLVTFELFGQLANTFEPADALFERAVDDLADRLGL